MQQLQRHLRCESRLPLQPCASRQPLQPRRRPPQQRRAAAAAPDAEQAAAAAAGPPSQQQLAEAAAAAVPPERQLDAQAAAEQAAPGLPPTAEPAEEPPKRLAPNARLSEALASTSITIFGDDTDLNWAVCAALSKKLGWFPVSTSKVLLGLHKADSVAELLAREGREAIAKAEADMLRGMRDQLRCCVATLGDGAAADPALYQHLHGTIKIWLDEQDKRSPKAPSVARALYEREAEVRAAVAASKGGFGEKGVSAEDKAARAATQIIKAMLQLLKDNDDLLVRKRLYIELGCRGDWPKLQPPEWNPVVEALDRKPVT